MKIGSSFSRHTIKIEAQGLNPMIQTDTNTHLFIHDENMRQLLKYKDGRFITSKSEKSYSKEDLFNIIENRRENIK